ncbi:MAG TPA: hypothetical protein VK173_02020, partial [Lacibacter sp.]|nr:hypothetical protein [Lacibacter sp.]
MKAFFKILFSALVLFTLGRIDYPDPVTAFTVIGGGAAVLTASIVPAKFWFTGTLAMGLDVEVWKKYIIEKLRKDNAFMFMSKDDSRHVLGGAVVHIPQAGDNPVVVKNRNSYPATTVRRTDTDITYVLDSYSTDPTHIPWAEIQTLSYDKLDSVLGGHVRTLGETIADDLLIKWSPVAAQFVLTTGGPTALTQAAVTGQTGTRKIFHQKDLIKAMTAMNVANVPKAGRKALIDDNMFEGFYDSLSDSQMNAFQQFADNKNGVVGRLHGFDIMTRSSVLAYSAANAVKALGTA